MRDRFQNEPVQPRDYLTVAAIGAFVSIPWAIGVYHIITVVFGGLTK